MKRRRHITHDSAARHRSRTDSLDHSKSPYSTFCSKSTHPRRLTNPICQSGKSLLKTVRQRGASAPTPPWVFCSQLLPIQIVTTCYWRELPLFSSFCLGPHIPIGTLCQVMTFPSLPTFWVPPLNYNTPAMVLVNMSTRSVHVQTNQGLDKKVYNSKERKEAN